MGFDFISKIRQGGGGGYRDVIDSVFGVEPAQRFQNRQQRRFYLGIYEIARERYQIGLQFVDPVHYVHELCSRKRIS
jgi:hypothetical protein